MRRRREAPATIRGRGIQCPGRGASIFANTFVSSAAPGGIYTSTQHPDMIQGNGRTYHKIYGNEFVNIGDSGINYEWMNQNNPKQIRMYNNLFRLTNAADAPGTTFPSYIRMYDGGNGQAVATITDVKILNNTFLDNGTYCAIWVDELTDNTTPASGSGNEIKNNIFYNVGSNVAIGGTSGQRKSATVRIGSMAKNAFPATAFNGTVYHVNSAGASAGAAASVTWDTTNMPAASWVASHEASGTTTAPVFTNYLGYHGTGRNTRAVYRRSNKGWYIYGAAFNSVTIGHTGDIPVPRDYNGDG